MWLLRVLLLFPYVTEVTGQETHRRQSWEREEERAEVFETGFGQLLSVSLPHTASLAAVLRSWLLEVVFQFQAALILYHRTQSISCPFSKHLCVYLPIIPTNKS